MKSLLSKSIGFGGLLSNFLGEFDSKHDSKVRNILSMKFKLWILTLLYDVTIFHIFVLIEVFYLYFYLNVTCQGESFV